LGGPLASLDDVFETSSFFVCEMASGLLIVPKVQISAAAITAIPGLYHIIIYPFLSELILQIEKRLGFIGYNIFQTKKRGQHIVLPPVFSALLQADNRPIRNGT